MASVDSLLAKAMNNSSAPEAAQALKMAASVMQKEGINPKDILSVKGEASTDDIREVKKVAIHWCRKAKEWQDQAHTFKTLYEIVGRREEDLQKRLLSRIRDENIKDDEIRTLTMKLNYLKLRFIWVSFMIAVITSGLTFMLSYH